MSLEWPWSDLRTPENVISKAHMYFHNSGGFLFCDRQKRQMLRQSMRQNTPFISVLVTHSWTGKRYSGRYHWQCNTTWYAEQVWRKAIQHPRSPLMYLIFISLSAKKHQTYDLFSAIRGTRIGLSAEWVAAVSFEHNQKEKCSEPSITSTLCSIGNANWALCSAATGPTASELWLHWPPCALKQDTLSHLLHPWTEM